MEMPEKHTFKTREMHRRAFTVRLDWAKSGAEFEKRAFSSFTKAYPRTRKNDKKAKQSTG